MIKALLAGTAPQLVDLPHQLARQLFDRRRFVFSRNLLGWLPRRAKLEVALPNRLPASLAKQTLIMHDHVVSAALGNLDPQRYDRRAAHQRHTHRPAAAHHELVFRIQQPLRKDQHGFALSQQFTSPLECPLSLLPADRDLPATGEQPAKHRD